jgi:hypothetical protein
MKIILLLLYALQANAFCMRVVADDPFNSTSLRAGSYVIEVLPPLTYQIIQVQPAVTQGMNTTMINDNSYTVELAKGQPFDVSVTMR